MSELPYSLTAVNIAPDASYTARDLGYRTVGKIDAPTLSALLEKFAALDISADDFDPHFIVTAPTGRFAIRVGRGTLLAYDTTDASHHFVELAASQIIPFLDFGPSGVPPLPEDVAATAALAAEIVQPKPAQRGRLALAGFAAAAGLTTAVVSAQLTLQPEPLDSDVTYTSVTEQSEISRLRNVYAGNYAPLETTRRQITVQTDGTIRYVAREIDGSVASDRVLFSEAALLTNRTPVFRTAIGPFEFRANDSVVFAKEVYVRQR